MRKDLHKELDLLIQVETQTVFTIEETTWHGLEARLSRNRGLSSKGSLQQCRT
jgi:hypothetical protein